MRFILYCILCLLPYFPAAQVLPGESALLNYKLVQFQIPGADNDNCIFEIAAGNYQNADSFKKNITIRQAGKQSGTIILLPSFNQHYTWRAIPNKKNKNEDNTGKLYHFKTGYSKYIDTSFYRTRIINQASPPANLYIFNDYLRTLSTLDGNAIWYLPDIPGVIDENTLVRDLKPNSKGTLTFLTTKGAYEIDLAGNILWQAPNDGRVSKSVIENYHHEFTCLPNGHYMLSGTESVQKTIPTKPNKENQRIQPNAQGTLTVQYETLIEYDTAKNIVWYWKAAEHIPDEIIFNKKNPDGTVNTSTHLNGFYFDGKKNIIYISFRDISSILKISYPAGNVLKTYNGIEDIRRPLFKSQHNCSINRQGDLYVYNNNNPAKHEKQTNKDITSTILILKEPGEGQALEKKWEFNCDIDKEALPFTNSGGSVFELQDGSLLVSMGATNRNFIVNKNKEVLWNAVTEKKDGDGKWVAAGTYRISCVETEQDLKKLIANTQ